MATQFLNIDSIGNHIVLPLHSDTVQQAVLLLEQPLKDTSADTVHTAVALLQHPITGRFLQQVNTPIDIILKNSDFSGWLTVGVLLLTFILSLIWYFFPERVLRLLSREGSKHKTKYSDNQFAKPGFVLYTLLGTTFIATTSLVVFLLAENFFSNLISDYSPGQFILIISTLIALYYLLRFMVIYAIGFLFDRQGLAAKQVKVSFRADIIQSFLLMPLLLILLNNPSPLFYYSGLVLLLLIVVYKWGISLYIGLKSSKISLYHNILYLCALEIVPVIVLLKLLESYGLVMYN
ncbi:MAG: hypothetical protein DRJ09_09145 [Bacteroidetes bacterium]|nr:MAG: hypothetical protein DRJ09_09145 [Bacteroidota bacterium]